MPVLRIIDLESFVNLEKILPSYHRNQYRNSLNIHLLYNVRNIKHTNVHLWENRTTFHSNILALEYIIKVVLNVRSYIPYFLKHLFVRTKVLHWTLYNFFQIFIENGCSLGFTHSFLKFFDSDYRPWRALSLEYMVSVEIIWMHEYRYFCCVLLFWHKITYEKYFVLTFNINNIKHEIRILL